MREGDGGIEELGDGFDGLRFIRYESEYVTSDGLESRQVGHG